MISARLTSSLDRPTPACLPVAFTRSAVVTAAVILFIVCGIARSACAAVHEEWNRRWDGPTHQNDQATKVAVDNDGNVYVAGFSDGGLNNARADYRLVKYASDGTKLWNRHYDGPAHGDDEISGLVLDASGNVFVTGASQGSSTNYSGYDYATLKYASEGTLLWTRRYDGPGRRADMASAIAVDAQGNAYVTGTSENAASGAQDEDYATIKYTPDGHTLWTRRYNGPRNYADEARALAVDSVGNAYVTGQSITRVSRGSAVSTDITTLKYSPNGTQLWVSDFTGNPYNSGNAIAVDDAGYVYIAGESSDPDSGGGFSLTLKYDASGRKLWQNGYQGYESYSSATSLALDPAGNVIVTGSGGTIKYAPGGTRYWVVDSPAETPLAVATDAGGNVYIAGILGDNGNFLLVKYGPDGRRHWDRSFDGPTGNFDAANALAVDDAGNVYVTGFSEDEAGAKEDMRTVKYSQ